MKPALTTTSSSLPTPIETALIEAASTPEMCRCLILATLEEVRRNPQLQQCDPTSLANAIVRMTHLDLNPVLPNECYLLPYANEVRLILGYGGLKKLVLRTEEVVDVSCQVVHENDHYEERNIDEPPVHRRPAKFAPRGSAIGYYAVARLKSGGHRVVTMSVDEVKQHRQRYSQAAKNRIWNNNFDEMALKTVLRKLCHPRQLPMDAEVAAALSEEESLYARSPIRALTAERAPLAHSPAAAAQAAETLFGEGAGARLLSAAPPPALAARADSPDADDTRPLLQRLWITIREQYIDEASLRQWLKAHYHTESTKTLSAHQLREIQTLIAQHGPNFPSLGDDVEVD